MKNKITHRLVLYFSLTLLVFALIIGSLFSFLFVHYTSDLHIKDMKRRAITLADTLSSMPDYAAQQQKMRQSAMHGNGMAHGNGMMQYGKMMHADDCPAANTPVNAPPAADYETYLRMFNDIAQSEVWLVDSEGHAMHYYGHANNFSYNDLPVEAEQLIEKVLQGDVVAGKNFSSLLGAPSITVGAPIRDSDGSVTAALLLHRTVKDMTKTETGGFMILAGCLLLAFLLSILLSGLLARRFIRPLRRMEETAAQLAEGNYEVTTGIHQDDEIGSLAASLDILSQRLDETRKESARLDQMRQDFITNTSHELRTPITVLRGSLEVLQAGLVADGPEKEEYLAQMMTNILHLQRLVNDLLELSRLQNADFSIDMQPLNLQDVLQDALHGARPLAEPRNIQLQRQGETAPLLLTGDYGRLRQMFMILLDNAIKFSPPGSRIELTVQGEGAHWQIDLQDHGCGIAPEELPHIFERFRRAHNEQNKNGTGLGLAIAGEIAQRHGITLTCASKLHEGTCFTFRK